jgi:YD repeat-containing protein
MLGFGYTQNSSGALAHDLARLTDAAGHVYVENSYDSDDRVVSQRYGTGTISYEYTLGDVHADDTPESIGTGAVIGRYVAINRSTDRRGNIVEHAYDRFGNLLERRVSGTGSSTPIVTRYAYDAEHRLISETRPSGAGVKYSYDARGNRIETRLKADMSTADDDALDLVDRRQYDQTNDRPIRRIAPDGTVTDYAYDSRLRLVETIARAVRLGTGS